MTKTFTQNDVLRYLYTEMVEEEKEEFLNALQEDAKLVSVLNNCRKIVDKLDGKLMDPPEHIIQSVLEYSANYDPETST